MNILSQLRNSVPGLPHSVQGLFRDDRLYRYLNVYPLKGLCKGRTDNHAERAPPIHTLPVELLAEIFRHYVQIVDYSQPSHSLSVQPYSQTTPFLLAEVCYYWRSVALSMGDLWQSMFIGPPKMEHIPLVRLWLNHAGEYPLSLSLFQSDRPSDSEIQATNEILTLLVNRLHRWRTIDFRFSAVVHQVLLAIPHGSAVSLEAAHVDVRDWDRTSADKLWRALHSSPTICRPEWVNFYWSGPPNHAPWAQLTHITLEGLLPSDVILSILQQCQSVVNLVVPHLVPGGTSYQMRPVVLPHLCSMSISAKTELDPLFQSLLLPSLVSLNITYRRDACNMCSSLHLDDLISRSQCQLRKLTLCDTDMNESEDKILDHLRIPALQSLIELKLFNPVSDKTIRLLSSYAEKEQLLPRLQSISLTCCTSDGVLSDMIVSRLPTLRTIHLSLRCDKHSYHHDRALLDNIQRKECHVEVELF
ncbi:hypothetical protein L208DRAFT_1441500 [Tricholoma matsutake]|nr:hypothetical protein L208DRAFT_1441500 [Tricholoma matsutake 945]